jgi:hypothetical protein
MTSKHTNHRDELDFEHWAQLAQDDPEAFEASRQAAIEALLDSFPTESRERMRRLQWRIDQERKLAKSPMGACVRLSQMMWRQLLGEGGLRDRLADLAAGMQSDPDHRCDGQPQARVLAFARSRD